MLITRGTHTHHPPYPTKLPKDIAEELVEVIKGQDLLTMTARMFCVCST